MVNQTFFYTAFFSAIIMTISLKFMELFSFIHWSPIGWGKKTSLFSTMHFSVKWGLLLIGLFFVFLILYMMMFHLHAIPPAMSAIFFTLVGIIGIEWLIQGAKAPLEMIQAISIPLLSITAIILRFISGTAVFYYDLSKKE